MSGNILTVHGNAGEEEVLSRANILKANSLVSVAAHDADNLMITLTARSMNGNLHIVSLAEEKNTQDKLFKVGADKVISPYLIGGLRIAQAVIRPAVVDFLEVCGMTRYQDTGGKEQDLLMEQIHVAPNSQLTGKKLSETDIRKKFGIIVIAIKSRDQKMSFNPSPEQTIEVGDNLIVVGQDSQLQGLLQMAADPQHSG